MKVTVTGATGYIGQFVVEYLLKCGDSVHATTRHRESAEANWNHARLKWYEWNLDDPNARFDFLSGTECLVHAAFDHVPGRYRGGEGEDPRGFIERNTIGSLRLFQSAASLGIKRVVFISSRAVFGETSPENLVEPIADNQPTFPDTLYGIVKSTVEQIASKETALEFCAIRPTGAYGVIKPIEKSKWFDLCRGNLDNESEGSNDYIAKTEVHGGDIATAIRLLLGATKSEIDQQFFNCSDVALSPVQLKYLVNLVRSGTDHKTAVNSLPLAKKPHHEMSSLGLEKLGWKKSGMQKVVETIAELVGD